MKITKNSKYPVYANYFIFPCDIKGETIVRVSDIQLIQYYYGVEKCIDLLEMHIGNFLGD